MGQQRRLPLGGPIYNARVDAPGYRGYNSIMTLNQNQIIAVPVIEIDPSNFLPPGVLNLRYTNTAPPSSSYTLPEDPTLITPSDPSQPPLPPTDGGSKPPALRPPATCTVVSQTVRVVADGSFVVDLVLDVEDVPGVTNYDVRVTKAVAP